MTNRFQTFAFSVNSTRPHEADSVAFSNLSTLESFFIEKDTSFLCGRDMKTQQNVCVRVDGRGPSHYHSLITRGGHLGFDVITSAWNRGLAW